MTASAAIIGRTRADPLDQAEARSAAPTRLLCACHDCGLLHRIVGPTDAASYRCRRCEGSLLTLDQDGNRRALAYALTSVILLLLANAFPLVTIDMQGNDNATSIFGAALAMWREDSALLAILVFTTTILIPAAELGLILYLLLPTRNARPRPFAASVMHLLRHVRPWEMTSVFMLGVLVALVKLGSYAQIILGTSFWSLCALLVSTTLLSAAFRTDALWRKVTIDRIALAALRPHLEIADDSARYGASIPRRHHVACHTCKLVLGGPRPVDASMRLHCPRCGCLLQRRKPDSISRTVALLIAAMVLYLPANLLPITNTGSFLGSQTDTIMSGVIYFWIEGSWPLAVLVFFASIMVPMLKMIALAILTITAARRSTWQMQQRTKLYRMIEFVGRWSMLDIYVIAIMTSLVQLGQLATFTAGPAAVAFGLVVVLTMVASMQYDPRLIWDPLGDRDGVTA